MNITGATKSTSQFLIISRIQLVVHPVFNLYSCLQPEDGLI
jgi:hypothetical protein